MFFFLKIYNVPTLCGNFPFNNYVGQSLRFNLMNLASMPGSAVLLFYRILKRGSVDFRVLSVTVNTKCATYTYRCFGFHYGASRTMCNV